MKAVIYARYSSDNQTEASIEGHFGNVWNLPNVPKSTSSATISIAL